MTYDAKGINEYPTTQDTIKLEFIITDGNGDPVNNALIWNVSVYFVRYLPGDPVDSGQLELISTIQGESIQGISGGITGYKPVWDGTTSATPVFVNTGEGSFIWYWSPTDNGCERQGNFIYVWTYTLPGESIRVSNSQSFYVTNDPDVVCSSPRIFNSDNYHELVRRMQPNFYFEDQGTVGTKFHNTLNQTVAALVYSLQADVDRFVELIDPDYAPTSFLPYLARMLNVKLFGKKSDRWRVQLKSAILAYKQKGTLNGLVNAFDSIGGRLTKVSQFWQITSDRQEVKEYIVEGSNAISAPDYTWSFTLPFHADPTATSYIKLYYWDTDHLSELTPWSDYFDFEGVTTIKWKATAPVSLSIGDTIIVYYPIQPPEYHDTQWDTLQDYILTLDLWDNRDFTPGLLPPKNWNTRLVNSEDPYFQILCPNRYTDMDPVIFGYDRTYLPYSEQVYNVDEYDGSIRTTTDPCKISVDFIDTCSCCKSSAVELSVEQDLLGDMVINDVLETANKFIPFHTTIHKINWSSKVYDLVLPPSEHLYVYIRLTESEAVFVGRHTFKRDAAQKYLRDGMGTLSTLISGTNGTRANVVPVLNVPFGFIESEGIDADSKVYIAGTVVGVVEVRGNSAAVISELPSVTNGPFAFYNPRKWSGNGTVDYSNGSLRITLPTSWTATDYDVSPLDYVWVRPKQTQDPIMVRIDQISGNILQTSYPGWSMPFPVTVEIYRQAKAGDYAFVVGESTTISDNSVNFVTSGVVPGDYVFINGTTWRISSVAKHELDLLGPPLPLDVHEYQIQRLVPYPYAITRDGWGEDVLLVMSYPVFPFLIPIEQVTELGIVDNRPRYKLRQQLRENIQEIHESIHGGVLEVDRPSEETGVSETLRIDIHNLNNNQHTIINI